METKFTPYSATERVYLKRLFETIKYEVIYSDESLYDHWDAMYFNTELNKWVIIEAKVRTSLYTNEMGGFIIEKDKFEWLKEMQQEYLDRGDNVQVLYMNFVYNNNNVYYYDLTNMTKDDLNRTYVKRPKYTAIEAGYKSEPAYRFESEYKIREIK